MRIPDPKAPRYRVKFRNSIGRTFLDDFRKKYPQHTHYSDKQLTQTIKEHLKLIPQEVVDNRDGVELPANLGVVFIGMVPGTKKKNRGIAWNQSTKLGTIVHYKNHETDGKLVKIHYCNYKSKLRFESRHLWGFTAVRPLKKMASESALKCWNRYISMEEGNKLIWELFSKKLYKDRMLKSQKKILKVYNEFE